MTIGYTVSLFSCHRKSGSFPRRSPLKGAGPADCFPDTVRLRVPFFPSRHAFSAPYTAKQASSLGRVLFTKRPETSCSGRFVLLQKVKAAPVLKAIPFHKTLLKNTIRPGYGYPGRMAGCQSASLAKGRNKGFPDPKAGFFHLLFFIIPKRFCCGSVLRPSLPAPGCVSALLSGPGAPFLGAIPVLVCCNAFLTKNKRAFCGNGEYRTSDNLNRPFSFVSKRSQKTGPPQSARSWGRWPPRCSRTTAAPERRKTG